jgi:hypothetical protein
MSNVEFRIMKYSNNCIFSRPLSTGSSPLRHSTFIILFSVSFIVPAGPSPHPSRPHAGCRRRKGRYVGCLHVQPSRSEGSQDAGRNHQARRLFCRPAKQHAHVRIVQNQERENPGHHGYRCGEQIQKRQRMEIVEPEPQKPGLRGSSDACIVKILQRAPVAQLDRAFDYESKGRKFESCRAHQ